MRKIRTEGERISMPESSKATSILSDITVYMKYARFREDLNRRETWEEIVDRNIQMHLNKFPELEDEIREAYSLVYTKKVLPSMRSMQFAGKPVEVNPSRMYNCSFLHINHPDAFSETMFLLLGGTGVGYSVQQHHVNKLPPVFGSIQPEGRQRKKRYLIGDSIEGWADAVKVLVESYFYGKREIDFDFRDIRPKGAALITSGGKAPGPQPLRETLVKIQNVFETAIQIRGRGTKLQPIEVHDILCHIADGVLAGGIRRAAMIALFSFNDEAMLNAKSGNWEEQNIQRSRANNSAVILRSKVKKADFDRLWEKIQISTSGEPGVFFTYDEELGTNPCGEISLKHPGLCNVTEINSSNIESQEDLNARSRAASFIGTLQAAYTDFHYLREIWRENAEKEALLGVSMTGIASKAVLNLDLTTAAQIAVAENIRVAALIGIRPAKRVTTIKPAGTTSLVLGTSSGIHAWFNDYYIRRIRVSKSEAIYGYLSLVHPDIVKDDVYDEKSAVIEIPQKAPDDALLRSETPIETLERVKLFHENWINPGHIDGKNNHNVSCTIYVKEDEWDIVKQWMWKNQKHYTGVAVLPYDGGNYPQTPFEDIDETAFNKRLKKLLAIDLTKVLEGKDNTALVGELACAGGACQL